MVERKKTTRKQSQAPEFVPNKVQAALDSTFLNPRNFEYYAGASGGPASQTFDRSTRQTAQRLCEYEYLNDTTLFGACLKASSLIVGVGATLKIHGPYLPYNAAALPELEKKCQFLEEEWSYYARQTRLWQTIRLIPKALIYHGEIFLRKFNDPIEERFRYELIRPERIGNPYDFTTDPCVFDGIRFSKADGSGEPVSYYIRKEYVNPFNNLFEYEEVPANEIIHVFTPILPEQTRGVPPFQAGLPKIAQMRQLVKAELTAMINSAKLAVVLHTENPEVIEEAARHNQFEGFERFAKFEVPDGGLIAPPGYEPTMTDSKHPSTGFSEIKKIMASDVGGTIGLGSGKINNDHSAYNYSSAKMDEQIDDVVIEVAQDTIATEVLDPIFEDWIDAFADGNEVADEFLFTAGIPERIKRRWLWPQPKSLDPLKDAQTLEIELRNGATTLEDHYAKRRKDAKEEVAKWKAERVEIAKGLEDSGLGLSSSGNFTTALPTEPNEGEGGNDGN